MLDIHERLAIGPVFMNPPSYCYDINPVSDFAALCECFQGTALQSPYRSTVPLLSLVGHSPGDWQSLLKSWGLPDDVAVHFEYCVASSKVGGNPSQTDAVITSDKRAVAIEAKWTEPRYPTVSSRIRKPEADGGDPRITVRGWLGHLNSFATRPLDVDDVADVVYQVIHRAASACAIAVARNCRPHLVYLHFHPSPHSSSATTAQYARDLQHLHDLLGRPREVSFSVVEMPLRFTDAFESIRNLDKRDKSTSAHVRQALCRGPLFTFGTPTARLIEGGAG
jgi:hypothetical protein